MSLSSALKSALAIVMHSCYSAKQNVVHTSQKRICILEMCSFIEQLQISAAAECWSNYMCLIPYIKAAPHPQPSSNITLHSAACHRHCKTSRQRNPMQQQSESLQCITHNHRVLHMTKAPRAHLQMQHSTVAPTP